jgi:hypothetical protein
VSLELVFETHQTTLDNEAGLATGWTALVVDLIIDPPGVRPGTSS